MLIRRSSATIHLATHCPCFQVLQLRPDPVHITLAEKPKIGDVRVWPSHSGTHRLPLLRDTPGNNCRLCTPLKRERPLYFCIASDQRLSAEPCGILQPLRLSACSHARNRRREPTSVSTVLATMERDGMASSFAASHSPSTHRLSHAPARPAIISRDPNVLVGHMYEGS